MAYLIFRFDFGSARGWGHAVRMSAIAEGARKQGLRTIVLTHDDYTGLPKDLHESFDEWIHLDARKPSNPTLEILLSPKRAHTKAIIVDHYDYEPEDIKRLQALGFKCLWVVDEPEAKHALADWVLAPGVGPQAPSIRYRLKSFREEQILSGARFALVRDAFASKHAKALGQKACQDDPWRLLVIFGGTDTRGLAIYTLQVLAEVFAGKGVSAEIDLVSGVGLRPHVIDNVAQKFSALRVHIGLSAEKMAMLMTNVHGAITACGGTVAELATIGVPFIGVMVADNQMPTAEALKECLALPVLDYASLDDDTLRAAWDLWCEHRLRWARTLAEQFDGQGVMRVLEAIK